RLCGAHRRTPIRPSLILSAGGGHSGRAIQVSARAFGAADVCTGGGAMRETDTALVLRARAGDRAAFEELVRRTSRLIFARLYLDTGSVHRAEDLLQETLLLAYRSLRKLTDPSAFRPWVLGIAHNVLIDA